MTKAITNKHLNLWQYNKITGYWKFVRDLTPDTAAQYLAIFQADEPNETFKIATRKPR